MVGSIAGDSREEECSVRVPVGEQPKFGWRNQTWLSVTHRNHDAADTDRNWPTQRRAGQRVDEPIDKGATRRQPSDESVPAWRHPRHICGT
jgi:hypothetical protein